MFSGKPRFAFRIANRYRLLIVKHPPSDCIFGRDCHRVRMRMMMIAAVVEVDFLCRFIELNDPVERQHLAQFARQQFEQLFWIPMAANRLRDPNQRAIPRANRSRGNVKFDSERSHRCRCLMLIAAF